MHHAMEPEATRWNRLGEVPQLTFLPPHRVPAVRFASAIGKQVAVGEFSSVPRHPRLLGSCQEGQDRRSLPSVPQQCERAAASIRSRKRARDLSRSVRHFAWRMNDRPRVKLEGSCVG